MTKLNRNFKDNLFKSYFGDKERLIEAYNAIAGKDYPPTAKVEFRKIENVLFRSQTNDLAFLLEDRFIVLIEAQSTINENMPLRMLGYINEILKGFLPKDALYRKGPDKIPTPEFFVIYNGLDDYPERKVLRLSDMFVSPVEEPGLELAVTVCNIAKGKSAGLLKKSAALYDYAMFVSVAQDYLMQAKSPDEYGAAIKKTIDDCKKNGIMVAYLNRHGSEVQRMLSYEWDDEVYRKVLLEEGREEGREEGERKRSLEVARNLKVEGAEAALIVKVTGLSEDAIAAL